MINLFGKIGFFVSSCVYFFCFILLFLTHTKSSQRNVLAITLIAMMLCSIATAFYIHHKLNYLEFIFFETFRNIFWAIILLNILKYSLSKNWLALYQKIKFFTFLFPILIPAIEITLYFSIRDNQILITFHLTQSILILLLLEQLFRKTIDINKWKIKPLCIGLGLIYTYDFAFYADALLLHNIDNDIILAKGWISFLASPFILLSIRRVKNLSMKIYISRNIIFNSVLLISSGLYLLSMTFIGFFINYLNYTWSNIAQHIFLSLSFILFASLFFSDSFRYRIKKFIVKHFYENKYDYCKEWINFSETLENKIDTPYQVALSSMMKPFNCNEGILLELNGERLISKAKHNIEQLHYVDILTDLACKAVNHKWIIDLDELKKGKKRQPFDYDQIKITYIDQVKYIIPIIEPGNVKFVCILSNIHHSDSLNFEDRELMRVLSKNLSIFLDLHITNNYLVENQQFTAFNQMSTFLVHDLKNILAQLNLIVMNSQKHKNNIDFIEDTFITVDSASKRLNKVLSHLLKHKVQEYNNETIDICDIIIKAFNERAKFTPKPSIADHFNKSTLIVADKDKLANIFLNLIKNAQDACQSDGSVKIYRLYKQSYFGICIEDNGEGMTEDFIANRLFKPFDTTKGNAGLGVGAYDAKKFIEQLGGYMDVISIKGNGTRFEIYIPLLDKYYDVSQGVKTTSS